jgi:hypothetical protein
MNWSDWENYLKPSHLNGRKALVVIDKVVIKETHPRPGKTEQAPVLYFKDRTKGLILSAINRRKLAQLFGDNADNCVGQTVMLEAVPVEVGRKTEHPIRIFAAGPGPAAQAQATDEASKTVQ